MPGSYLFEGGSNKRPRSTVRGALLRMLIAVQVPILIVGLMQGISGWNESRNQQQSRLSASAMAIAAQETGLASRASATLGLLAEIPELHTASPACSDTLRRIVGKTPPYSNILRIHADGQIACSAHPADPALQGEIRGWIADLEQPGKRGSMHIFQPGDTHAPMLLAAEPIHAANNRFDGAMVLVMNASTLLHAARVQQLSIDGKAAIANADGVLITPAAPAGMPAIAPLQATGTVQTVRDPQSGQRWSYVATPFLADSSRNQPLFLILAEPHPGLFSAIWWRSLLLFALPVLAIILSSIAIWRGVDGIVLRWIAQLRSLARAFARGEYRARAPGLKDAPIELRNFAADLHRMALAIDERDQKLLLALEEEQRLVREVHHRVRNNLQVMMSMLSLQAQHLPPGEGKVALEQARLRVSAIALVYQLGYASNEQGVLSAAILLPELVARFQTELHKKVETQIVTEAADIPLALDTAVAIAIWLSESLVRVLRLALPDSGGVVRVTIVQKDQLILSVEAEDVASVPDADCRFSLHLAQAIARQLAGISRHEAVHGGGSISTLLFPLPEPCKMHSAREPATRMMVGS